MTVRPSAPFNAISAFERCCLNHRAHFSPWLVVYGLGAYSRCKCPSALVTNKASTAPWLIIPSSSLPHEVLLQVPGKRAVQDAFLIIITIATLSGICTKHGCRRSHFHHFVLFAANKLLLEVHGIWHWSGVDARLDQKSVFRSST